MPATKLKGGAGVRAKMGLCAKLRTFNLKALEHIWTLPGKWDQGCHSGTTDPEAGSGYGGVRLPYNALEIELKGFESDGLGPGMGGVVRIQD